MYPRCGAVSFPGTLWCVAAASGGLLCTWRQRVGEKQPAVPQFPQPAQGAMGAERPCFWGRSQLCPRHRLLLSSQTLLLLVLILLGKDPRGYRLQLLTQQRHPRAGGWWHLELLHVPAVGTSVLYPLNTRAHPASPLTREARPPGISRLTQRQHLLCRRSPSSSSCSPFSLFLPPNTRNELSSHRCD